jgi:hypothetical protein
MSGFVFVNLIAAQSEGETNSAALVPPDGGQPEEQPSWGTPGDASNQKPGQEIPTHNFPSQTLADQRAELHERDDWDPDPDVWLYRRKTTALLRRYMRWSLEAGRLPSLLGRELFRSRISVYSAITFEERVIFLHDVEGCLERLQDFDQQIIARVVLQEYDHDAAAQILQCDRKTIERRLPELIDELTEVFLRAELLERLPEANGNAL